MAVNVFKICHVAPSKGAPHEQILPLQNFDIVRLPYHLLNFLFFYKLPCSESHFLNAIVPRLNATLSVALKHFVPFAGKIVFPLSASAMPFSRYVDGDSVPVTIAISNADFNHVTGNHSRDSDIFHGFSPLTLPHSFSPNDSIQFSPLAIQVTLFPNQGICISQTVNHAISDGGTILALWQAWASIHKFNDDAHLIALRDKFARSYDRSSVSNKALAARAWNYAKAYSPTISLTISLPTNKVRATFYLSNAEIQTLKNIALAKKPGMARTAATYTVLVGAYVWSCLAKSAAVVMEDVSDDEAEYFTCTADIRASMNPPLPFTYFGNCTVLVLAESTHGTLKSRDGFACAAHAIGEALRKNKKENVVDDLEHRLKVKGGNKRVVTIAGSPRFEMYGVDYGWGRPEKFEYPTGDCDGSVCLSKARAGGGSEIVLSMETEKMEAFAACFKQGLKEATESSYMNIIQSNL